VNLCPPYVKGRKAGGPDAIRPWFSSPVKCAKLLFYKVVMQYRVRPMLASDVDAILQVQAVAYPDSCWKALTSS